MDLEKLRQDPLAFVLAIIPWGEEGWPLAPAPWQLEVLQHLEALKDIKK